MSQLRQVHDRSISPALAGAVTTELFGASPPSRSFSDVLGESVGKPALFGFSRAEAEWVSDPASAAGEPGAADDADDAENAAPPTDTSSDTASEAGGEAAGDAASGAERVELAPASAIPLTINGLNFQLLSGGATARARAALREPATGDSDDPSSSSRRDQGEGADGGRRPDVKAGSIDEALDPRAIRSPANSHGNGSEALDAGVGTNARSSRAPREATTAAQANREGSAAGAPKPRDAAQERSASAHPARPEPKASGVTQGIVSADDALRRLGMLGGRTGADGRGGPLSMGAAAGMHVRTAPVQAASGRDLDGPKPHVHQPPHHETHEPVSIQVMRSVAAALQRRAADSTGGSATDSAVIALRPAALGQLTVRIDVTDGVVSASFESRSEVARDLLKSGVADLREQLEARGMTVDRLEVTYRNERPVLGASSGAESPNLTSGLAGAGGSGGAEPSYHGATRDASNESDGSVGDGTGREGARDDPGGKPGHQGSSFRERERDGSAEPIATRAGDGAAWTPLNGIIDALA